MRAYGAKRTHGGCRTKRQVGKRKIHVLIAVKNRKKHRKFSI